MLAVLIALAAGTLQSAFAAGTPNITLAKSAPARVLFGSPSTVTLTATSPAGQPYGYNLSFRDVLPAGVSYVPGSSPIAPAVLANQPSAGQTTLIWSNVSDLAPSSSRTLTYQVVAQTSGVGALRVGDSYTNNAGAYIEGTGGERDLPKFDPTTGVPDPLSYTGSALAGATSELVPLKIVKSEPSPEGELLRGVHDHQTTYTLTVSNNLVNPTNTVVVDDYLPAGLEFLGCANVDNTTTGPEYPGSGSLVGAPPGTCPAPVLVDTVLDPAGHPAGVYTHVQWALGNLAAGAVRTIQYKAGIPIHANTMTFAGGTPSAAGLGQAANLDNNTGPEAQDEQALTNYSSAGGAYQGAVNPAPALPLAAVDQITRSAEDLRILKSVDPSSVAHGQLSTWSLDIATSEYRGASGIFVTDTLPNGLCPLGAANYTHAPQTGEDAECDPQSGVGPSLAYASDPTEQANGSWIVTFDVADLGQDGDTVVTFPSVTRVHYQTNYANATTVLSNDSWPNTVHVDGVTTAIPNVTPTVAYPAGTAVIDNSSASQSAGVPSITKQVATRASIVGGACPTTAGSYVQGPAGAEYRAGDLVCWRVTLPFSSADDTTITSINDFLPAGYTFIPGSELAGPTNSLPGGSSISGTASGSTIQWTGVGDPIALSNPATTLVPRHSPAYVLDVIFKTRITNPGAVTQGDIKSNLVKTSSINTAGIAEPIRSSADASIDVARLSLLKGVKSVNAGAPNGPNVDGVSVAPGNPVVFRVDISNSGQLATQATTAWDVLPLGTPCSAVSGITTPPGASAACTDDLSGAYTGRAVIRWTGLAVPAAGSLELDYTVVIPSGVYAPAEAIINNAGVVSYQTATNDPSNPTVSYVPASNIDPTAVPTANTPAASDGSSVVITAAAQTKTRTTPLVEGNNTAATATIGEQIDYTITETIPAGTVVHAGALDDIFASSAPARQVLVGSPAMTLDGGTATGFTLSSTASTMHVAYPATFSAGGSARVLVVTYSTRVTDVAANVRAAAVGNQATLGYQDSAGASHSLVNTTSTTIVEPRLTIAKSHTPASPARFAGGDTITYTLTVTNPNSGVTVSPAHEVAVQDVVPAGLTPTGTQTGGTTRSISGQMLSWTISSLAAGGTATLTYAVTVDDPVESNRSFTNHAGAITSSLTGSDPNERSATDPTGTTGPVGYRAATTDTVSTHIATIVKIVSPITATVGDVVTYTIQATVPHGVGLTGAHIDDVLPAGVTYDSQTSATCAAAGGGACSPAITIGAATFAAGTRSWALTGADSESAADRIVTIVYSAHITGGTLGQVKTNTASIKWTAGGVAQTVSDPADVTITEPVVQINKHVSCDGTVPNVDATGGETDACNVIAGQALTYTIVVRNTGTAAAHDITITDTKAAHLVNVGSLSNGGSLVGNVITWNLAGPLAVGASLSLTYTGEVAAASTPLTQGETIVNTAVVSDYWGQTSAYRAANPTFVFTHYQPAPATGSTRDIVTLTVRLPHLTVTKTHAGSFTRGTTDAYTITVGNNGTTATTGTVTLDDELPAGLELNGAPTGTGWLCIPTTTTHVGCSTTGVAPAAGALPVVTVPVTVLTTAPNSVTNTATANGGGDPTAPASGGNTSPVIWNYDIALDKTVDHAVAQPGDQLTYTVTATNNGPALSQPGAVTDTLPAGLTLVSAPGCVGAPLVCAIPALASGDSRTFTITATIDNGVANGTALTNSATVATPNDTNAGNNTDSAVTTAHDPLLTVTKTHPGSFTRGTSDHYDVTVSNASTFVPTKGPVTVADDVPAGLTPTAATGTGWTCTITLQHVACARTNGADTLAPTAAWPLIRVDVNVLAAAPGSLVNNAVASGGNDPTPATGSNTSPAIWNYDLALVKTVDHAIAQPGDQLIYTITVTNNAPGISEAGSVTDTLPAGLTLVSAPGCVGAPLVCAIPALLSGDSRTFTITATIDNGVANGTTLTNTAVVATPNDGNAANDSGSAVATSHDPALAVTKTHPGPFARDVSAHYDITVSNASTFVPTEGAVTVADDVPAGLTPTAATGTGWTCTIALQHVACARTNSADTLAPTTAWPVIRIDVDVLESAPSSLVNDAVASGGNDPTPATGSDTSPVVWDADLGIVKTADRVTQLPGGHVVYTLTVTNHGPGTSDIATLSDTIPSAETFVSVAPTPDCEESAGTVTCDFGHMGSGEVQTVTIETALNAGLLPQLVITNTADVSAPSGDSNPANDSSSVDVAVGDYADIQIVKSGPATVVPGGVIDYSLTVTNNGPTTTALNTVVTDTLPAGLALDRSSVAIDGIAAVLQSGVPATGECAATTTLTCALGGLAVGDTHIITFSVSVPGAPADLKTAYENLATVSSDTPELPQDIANDISTWTTSVPYADVAIAKSASAASAYPGGAVVYTLTATNHGPDKAASVVIDDTLPAGLTPTSATVSPAGSGSCAISGQSVHCALGDRTAGDVVAVSVSASVDPQLTPQTLINTAVIGATNDFDPNNDTASASVEVTNKPPTDLAIDKALRTTDLTVGAPAIYRLTVSNLGANDAENVVVTDALPGALDFHSLSAPAGWSCTRGRVIACTLAKLAAGASATIELSAIATSSGQIVNTATVSSTTADSVPSNNHHAVAGRFHAARTRLGITKTTPTRKLAPGSQVRYTITVRNTGSAAAVSAKLCDAVPLHMTIVSAPGAKFRNGSACWKPSLAAGGKKTVSLVLRIDSGTPAGRIANTARVSAANATARDARATISVTPGAPKQFVGGITG